MLEFLQRAARLLLHRSSRPADTPRDLGVGQLVDEMKQQHMAVRLRQRIDGIIQMRQRVAPCGVAGIGRIDGCVHEGLLFAGVSGFAAKHGFGLKQGGVMQPGRQRGAAAGDLSGFLGQADENPLGDILRQRGVAESPACRVENEAGVAIHQHAEWRILAAGRVTSQKFPI